MGKASMCMQMLQILNSGRIYKCSELASLLETNSRNIIEYKKELEEAGYFITSIPGKYGGYKLEKNELFPSLKLTEEEKSSLSEAYNYVLSKKDFIQKKPFQSAMGKAFSSLYMPELNSSHITVDKYQLTMDEQNIQDRYAFIEYAINKKKVIEITYNSLKSGLKKHILHPYELFNYNNSWFFLAWDPEHGEVRYYKLNRIEEFKYLPETFKVWKYFDANKYFDQFGMANDGEYYHIELIATGVRATLFKERVYGKNQKIEKLDENSYKVSLDMQNKDMILSFTLNCMDKIKILSPQWLIDDIKLMLNKIRKIY